MHFTTVFCKQVSMFNIYALLIFFFKTLFVNSLMVFLQSEAVIFCLFLRCISSRCPSNFIIPFGVSAVMLLALFILYILKSLDVFCNPYPGFIIVQQLRGCSDLTLNLVQVFINFVHQNGPICAKMGTFVTDNGTNQFMVKFYSILM